MIFNLLPIRLQRENPGTIQYRDSFFVATNQIRTSNLIFTKISKTFIICLSPTFAVIDIAALRQFRALNLNSNCIDAFPKHFHPAIVHIMGRARAFPAPHMVFGCFVHDFSLGLMMNSVLIKRSAITSGHRALHWTMMKISLELFFAIRSQNRNRLLFPVSQGHYEPNDNTNQHISPEAKPTVCALPKRAEERDSKSYHNG